jgi:hypothetical protein
MAFKKIALSAFMLLSVTAHAIPPSPPEAIFKTLNLISLKHCFINNEVSTSELKNTETVKFVLKVDKESNVGVLQIFESGELTEELPVTCR